jgi:hypothetical protein
MNTIFPICNIKLEENDVLFPLPIPYSITDVIQCISGDCWGVYLVHSDRSYTSFYNIYVLYETLNLSLITTNPFEQDTRIRMDFISDHDHLLPKVQVNDILVIMLHRTHPIKICAKRMSEVDWEVEVYHRKSRINRFSFDQHAIQRMLEQKIEKQQHKIDTLKMQVSILEQENESITETLEKERYMNQKDKEKMEYEHKVEMEQSKNKCIIL